MGNVQLHHGDCLDIMPTMEPQSVDCILADIPYGTTACKWDTVIPFAPMWECIKRVIKPRGAVVLFGSQPFTSALVMSNPKWFKYQWVWDKVKMGNFLTAKLKPLITHEDICIFSPGNTANCSTQNMYYIPQMEKRDKPIKYKKRADSQLYARKNTVTIEYVSSVKYPKSIIRFDRGRNGMVHPTQKPVDLMAYLIRTYTNPGETVLDFTMGSGSTGVACIETGRNFIGIERDSTYFEVARKRLTQVEVSNG